MRPQPRPRLGPFPSKLGGAPTDELKCFLGHTLSEMARGGKIRFRRCDVGALICVRLRTGIQPKAESIQILVQSRRRIIRRRQAEFHPMHAVLDSEERDLDWQCVTHG